MHLKGKATMDSIWRIDPASSQPCSLSPWLQHHLAKSIPPAFQLQPKKCQGVPSYANFPTPAMVTAPPGGVEDRGLDETGQAVPWAPLLEVTLGCPF